jgi:hypothetical protein
MPGLPTEPGPEPGSVLSKISEGMHLSKELLKTSIGMKFTVWFFPFRRNLIFSFLNKIPYMFVSRAGPARAHLTVERQDTVLMNLKRQGAVIVGRRPTNARDWPDWVLNRMMLPMDDDLLEDLASNDLTNDGLQAEMMTKATSAQMEIIFSFMSTAAVWRWKELDGDRADEWLYEFIGGLDYSNM